MSTLTLWALLAIAHSFLLARAQSCLAGYEWANNAQGQSPCQVMERAQSALRINAPGGVAVFSPPNPGNQSPGFCSGAYWLLVSSCADCSGYGYYSRSSWLSSCTTSYPHLPPNSGLPADFQLPQWIHDQYNRFISQNRYDPNIATIYGGSPRPTDAPKPPQESNAGPIPTSPGATGNPEKTPASDSTPGSTNPRPTPTQSSTQGADETSTAGDSSSASASSTTTSSTSTPSHTTSRRLVETTISTTITTTDLNGLETTVTSAMPTLVDPSGSGRGDSRDPGMSLATAKKTNVGAIVGGIIAALAALALLIAALLVARRRRRNARVAPSTAFIKELNKEYEKYGEDMAPRMASPQPFSPQRAGTPSNKLSFVVDSQDQLLEKFHEREQER